MGISLTTNFTYSRGHAAHRASRTSFWDGAQRGGRAKAAPAPHASSHAAEIATTMTARRGNGGQRYEKVKQEEDDLEAPKPAVRRGQPSLLRQCTATVVAKFGLLKHCKISRVQLCEQGPRCRLRLAISLI